VTRSEFDALQKRTNKAENDLKMQLAQMKIMAARLDAMALAQQVGGAGGWGGGDAWGGWGPDFGKGGGKGKGGDSRGGPMGKGGMPPMMGRKPDLPTPPPGTVMQTTEEFAREMLLDERCFEVLVSQPHEVQQYVIGLGPVGGRNPSAQVMGRIAKASSEFNVKIDPDKMAEMTWQGGPIEQRVEEFLVNNSLDDTCGEVLRKQTPECQAAVVSQGAVEGRNPNAMVMGRIRKFSAGTR